MHAVIDSERKARNAQVGTIKQFQHDNAVNAVSNARHAHLVGSVTNLDTQMGNRLTTTEFMTKLRRVNGDLTSQPHPSIKGKELLYLTVGDTQTYLMPMEKEWMPEWSVFATKKVKVPYTTPTSFWQTIDIPGQEIKRGWRTVLIRLIQQGIIKVDAVEREFGTGGRPSWFKLTGKGYAKVEI